MIFIVLARGRGVALLVAMLCRVVCVMMMVAVIVNVRHAVLGMGMLVAVRVQMHRPHHQPRQHGEGRQGGGSTVVDDLENHRISVDAQGWRVEIACSRNL